jgi:hypothetical protein
VLSAGPMVPSKRGAAGTLLLGRREIGPPAISAAPAEQQHRPCASVNPSRVAHSCRHLRRTAPWANFSTCSGRAAWLGCALLSRALLSVHRVQNPATVTGARTIACALASRVLHSSKAGTYVSPLVAALQPTDAAPSGPLTLVPRPVPGVGPEMLQDPATDMAGVSSTLGAGP